MPQSPGLKSAQNFSPPEPHTQTGSCKICQPTACPPTGVGSCTSGVFPNPHRPPAPIHPRRRPNGHADPAQAGANGDTTAAAAAAAAAGGHLAPPSTANGRIPASPCLTSSALDAFLASPNATALLDSLDIFPFTPVSRAVMMDGGGGAGIAGGGSIFTPTAPGGGLRPPGQLLLAPGSAGAGAGGGSNTVPSLLQLQAQAHAQAAAAAGGNNGGGVDESSRHSERATWHQPGGGAGGAAGGGQTPPAGAVLLPLPQPFHPQEVDTEMLRTFLSSPPPAPPGFRVGAACVQGWAVEPAPVLLGALCCSHLRPSKLPVSCGQHAREHRLIPYQRHAREPA